jgi:hypothetical protein
MRQKKVCLSFTALAFGPGSLLITVSGRRVRREWASAK